MSGTFTTWQVELLTRAMTVAARRQEALANNVANADTPGFKRSDVHFREELERAGRTLRLVTTDGRHLQPRRQDMAPVPVREMTSGRSDGNNVDLEYELASLAENGLWYQALTRQLSARFALWRTAITEGRK